MTLVDRTLFKNQSTAFMIKKFINYFYRKTITSFDDFFSDNTKKSHSQDEPDEGK